MDAATAGSGSMDAGEDVAMGSSGAGSGAGSGASSGASSEGGAAATWTQVYEQIIQPKCEPCHNGNTSTMYGGGMDLYSVMYPPANTTGAARAYRNLVFNSTTMMVQLPKPNPAGLTGALAYKCFGKGKRVVPGNAAMSIFYSKVHDATPICGAPEPQAGVPGGPAGSPTMYMPLSAAEQDMIASWINAGAKEN
jgi:hypothetical protein